MAIFGPANSGIYTPGDVERKRRLAQMLAQDQFQAREPFGALAKALTGARSGALDREASAAESEGQSRVADALKSQDWMGAMGDPFATSQQSALASALLGRDWQKQDRGAQWAREDAQRAAQAAQPDWQFFESGGDRYRFNAKDPNSVPSKFFDGPEAPLDPIKVGAGETLLDPTTHQPIYQGAPDPKDAFAREKDIWAQYSNSDPVKTYTSVRDAYERMRESAAQQSGAGDLGLIYGYMKMLDPGSVVRESEFAMAAQAGSYGEQIQGLVSRVINGERLPQSVRDEFIQNAQGLYQQASGNLSDINSQFEQRAGAWQVNPKTFLRQPEVYDAMGKGGVMVSPEIEDLLKKYAQ